jgi:hypothetical protein
LQSFGVAHGRLEGEPHFDRTPGSALALEFLTRTVNEGEWASAERERRASVAEVFQQRRVTGDAAGYYSAAAKRDDCTHQLRVSHADERACQSPK